MTDLTTDLTNTDAGLAVGRWEQCGAFAADGPGSPVCAGCGWLRDDHAESAVIRRLPTRVRRSAQTRRLAS